MDKREFNWKTGAIGLVCGLLTGVPGMGLLLGFVFGYILFPLK
jgi:hypothetical protein